MWSMKSTPSRWSISCWKQTDCSPSARISTSSPSRFCARSSTRSARSTSASKSGTERHPSVQTIFPSCSESSGLTRISGCPLRILLGPLGVDHDESDVLSHLGRREPDAGLVVHHVTHVPGELAQGIVDLLDGSRDAAKALVGKLQDGSERHGRPNISEFTACSTGVGRPPPGRPRAAVPPRRGQRGRPDARPLRRP